MLIFYIAICVLWFLYILTGMLKSYNFLPALVCALLSGIFWPVVILWGTIKNFIGLFKTDGSNEEDDFDLGDQKEIIKEAILESIKTKKDE